MIERKSRYDVFKYLESNPNLNVVDLGSGTDGSCPYADVLVDLYDFSSEFKDKKFVVHDLNDTPLPFEDNEFDFSFASHVLEHIKEPVEFIKEIVRISKSGYIEVPTPLADNLVSGDDGWDPNGHKWWLFLDDNNKKLIARPRRNIVHKTVDVSEINRLYPFFRSSIVIELYWEEDINFEIGDEKYSYEEKEYDLSKDKIEPWVLGESVLSKRF